MLLLRVALFAAPTTPSPNQVPHPYGAAANASAYTLLDALRCDDAQPACDSWASAGECQANPDFMVANCRKACERCELQGAELAKAAELCRYSARNLLAMHSSLRAAGEAVADADAARALEALRACNSAHASLAQSAHALVALIDENCRGSGGKRPTECAPAEAEPKQLYVEDPRWKRSGFRHGSSIVYVGGASPAQMPTIGLGTWLTQGEECVQMVTNALAAGIRHIDTSENYANSADIGRALLASSVPRDELFLASKLSFASSYTREGAERALDEELRKLGTDYLDLLMLHSPGGGASAWKEAWRALESFVRAGRVRAIGVSNFNLAQLNELRDFAEIAPATLQNKFSPYHPGSLHNARGEDYVAFCKTNHIALVAYSPLNAWPSALAAVTDAHVTHIAAKLGKTPGQIVLRWAIEIGISVLTRSRSLERLKEAAAVLDFELSMADIDIISGLVHFVASGSHKPPSSISDVLHVGAAEQDAEERVRQLSTEL